MNKNTWIFTWLAIAAFATGCHQDQTTSQKTEKPNTEATAAAPGMQEYIFAQKAEFISIPVHLA